MANPLLALHPLCPKGSDDVHTVELNVAGSLAGLLAGLDLTSGGEVDVAGALASELEALALSAAAEASIGGASGATLGDLALAGVGTLTLEGLVLVVLANLSLVAAGGTDTLEAVIALTGVVSSPGPAGVLQGAGVSGSVTSPRSA